MTGIFFRRSCVSPFEGFSFSASIFSEYVHGFDNTPRVLKHFRTHAPSDNRTFGYPDLSDFWHGTAISNNCYSDMKQIIYDTGIIRRIPLKRYFKMLASILLRSISIHTQWPMRVVIIRLLTEFINHFWAYFCVLWDSCETRKFRLALCWLSYVSCVTKCDYTVRLTM